jgi:hypothetical protein
MNIRRLLLSALLFYFTAPSAHSQGMPLDSLLPRIGTELHNPVIAKQLRTLLPDYENLHVWGLSTGDFSNDSLPDLALSLYDHGEPGNKVRVYLFENVKGQRLIDRFEKVVTYVESPIEVGLTIEGSVVTITRKTGDQHWSQDGYSIESGDVVLIDHYETEQEDVTGTAKVKARAIGHEVYRNYESLRTRESYYTGKEEDAMFSTAYTTLPSYQRLREIYPGYGRIASDTTKDFVIAGSGFRRDANDLSIRSMQAAYNDDYLYLALRVRDDYVIGGEPKMEANDRVSLWFDTKYTGDRLNRDRRLLSNEGGFPKFRTELDSLVSQITFALPARPGRVTQMQFGNPDRSKGLDREAQKNLFGQMSYDTANGVVNGYALSVRIPFAFLGFETNPARSYETHVAVRGTDEQADAGSESTTAGGIGDAATLGFTAVVYDVDDASRPNEVTAQATSKFEEGNPSTFGTLVLEPSTLYYGEVHPTYLEQVRTGLVAAGY